jgi:outer membrane lipoprotein-sorting protein
MTNMIARRLSLVALTGVVAAFQTLSGADPILVQALAKMDQAAAHFKGLAANIQTDHHMEVIHEDDVQSGTILVKRAGRNSVHVKITIDKPEQKIAIADKKKFMVYYPSSGEGQQGSVGQKSQIVDAILTLGFGGTSQELQADYKVTLGGPDTVAGQSATRLGLVPKSQEMLDQWKKIDLWISDQTGYTLQQKFYEAGKDYNLITYTNVQPKSDIPDSAFELNVPKGTKIEPLNNKKK